MKCLAPVLFLLFVTPALAGSGIASWYGPKFHGRTTASGETFNQYAATCAHRTLPFGTRLKITNVSNGKSATCRISDRGPYSGGRSLDVSRAVAKKLGMVRKGTANVRWVVL